MLVCVFREIMLFIGKLRGRSIMISNVCVYAAGKILVHCRQEFMCRRQDVFGHNPASGPQARFFPTESCTRTVSKIFLGIYPDG